MRKSAYRAAIARSVSASWHDIPHFSLTRDASADSALRLLTNLKADGLHATVTDLLLAAAAHGLRDVDEFTGEIGLMVATNNGVAMSVVTDVPDLTFPEVVKHRLDAVERALDGRLSKADLNARPVLSVSNLGRRPVDSFTGIVPLGQWLLLTVGQVRDAVVIRGEGVAIGKQVSMTLNVDHRHLDGVDAADILADIIRAWENAEEHLRLEIQ